MGQTIDFTLELDGQMFENLISGMYSDKIAAPIREVSTNARDGHAAKGNLDVPFEVELPTVNTPEFSVRDFGTSLTHEEVMHTYSVLGKSTKRDSNGFTGCLGLGSKSPFAYTTAFTVVCWLDGKKRTYAAYKQTGGRPAISLVSTERSNEPQGVRVSFPVKASDVSQFNSTAKSVYMGFDPFPIIKRSSRDIDLTRGPLLVDGKSWKIYDVERFSTSKSYAIQGSVSYPIDHNNENLKSWIRKLTDDASYTSWRGPPALQILQSMSVFLEFPIGAVTNTTSREDLAYDDKTCEAIARNMLALIKDQKDQEESRFDKCKTLEEAELMYSKEAESSTYGKLARLCELNKKVVYKGKHLGSKIKFLSKGGIDLGINLVKLTSSDDKASSTDMGHVQVCYMNSMKSKYELGEFKPTFTYQNVTQYVGWSIHGFKEKARVYIEAEDAGIKSVNNKIRRAWHDADPESVNFWVRVSEKAKAADLFKDVQMDLDIIYLDELDDLKMPSKAGKNKPVFDYNQDVRTLPKSRYSNNSERSSMKIDLSGTTKYARMFAKGHYLYKTLADCTAEANGLSQRDYAREVADMASALSNTISDVGSVVILNTRQHKWDKEYPIFLSVEEKFKEELKKEIPSIPTLLTEVTEKQSDGEWRPFFRMFSVVPKDLLPNVYKEIGEVKIDHLDRTRTNHNQLNHSQSQLLGHLETYYPLEVAEERAKNAAKSEHHIDVRKFLNDDILLKMIYQDFNTWQSVPKSDELIAYCETLNKVEKQ